jgi:hypothetical protein
MEKQKEKNLMSQQVASHPLDLSCHVNHNVPVIARTAPWSIFQPLTLFL